MSDDNGKPVACVQGCFLCRDHDEGKEILDKARVEVCQPTNLRAKSKDPRYQETSDCKERQMEWAGSKAD